MMRTWRAAGVAAAVVAAGGAASPSGAAEVVGRPSVATGGTQGNGDSLFPTVSATGRFVAYVSSATNLVPADTNGVNDIFVRDRQNGTTERVSVSSQGAQSNDGSERPSISGNGRYVAFDSTASNLVGGDGNGHSDVFVRDRVDGTTVLVSVALGGSGANDFSQDPRISGDGRYVLFESGASNLVAGDANGTSDVFLRDLATGRTTLASVRPDGKQFAQPSFPAAISADGRYMAFTVSQPTGPWPAFLRDRGSGVTTRLSVGLGGAKADGDIFPGGVSTDGRFVAFTSIATNLVPGDTNRQSDIFVRDLRSGATSRVSIGVGDRQANGGSGIPTMSADGRYVAFDSGATNLVAGDTNGHDDVFVYDRQLDRIRRVSRASNGAQGNSTSGNAAISANGQFVAFHSLASNLIRGDTNGVFDVLIATTR